MPTALMVSGIAAIILSVLLLLFYLFLRRRYVCLLPALFHSAVDAILRNLSKIKTGGVEHVPLITSIFRNLNYDPLQNRWALCIRNFEDLGGGRAFLDVDEFFRMDYLLEEALERRNATEAGRWLFLGGAFAGTAVVSLGFLFSQGSQFNAYSILGLGLGVFSLASAFALRFRYEDARAMEGNMEDYTDLMARLKACLPPIGRNSLIQTLYLMQTEQADNLKKQTESLQKALNEYAIGPLTTHVGTVFHSAIEQMLHPPIQKMADVQTSLLNRLERDQQHRLEQLFILFTKEVGELMSKQLGGMTEQVNRAAGGMRDIVNSLHAVAGDVSATLTQNRETTVHNEDLLESLNQTHQKLMERFSESTILLDDILNSSKLLAESTNNTSLATMELAEQAGKVQKETGERFELLRTTLEERLTASTNAAVDLQGNLISHAEKQQSSFDTQMQALQAQQLKVQEVLDTQLQSVNGMLTELSESIRATFTDQSDTLSKQQSEAAQTLFATLAAQVEAMSAHTIITLEQAQAMNADTASRFGTEAATLFAKFDKQNQAVTQELQAQGRTNANLLSLTHKVIADSSTVQIKSFEEQTAQLTAAFEKQSSRLVEAWKENSTGFYNSLHEEARSLLNVLPTQMREAFDAFTSSMGETMRATLTDSVEIVDKLGERIQQLHSEFELYFSRTEGNTQSQISDMRFAMEGAIGKFSELSDASLTQMRDGNQEAMTAFSEQTRLLMESVDEQTRTLSLYVKDMGIDMADLNKGLKESVAEFTSHLHAGVTDTFQEFDTGLAEIVRRMTELGVRIEEAVEALPESIGRLSEGR